MKTNKFSLLSVTILALGLTLGGVGCSSTNISQLMSAMGTNSATVVANVGSVYGTVRVIRTNPQKGQDVTISPDGTVNIKDAAATK